MNTNQRRYVDSRIIPHLHRNVYPERCFCGHIAETCTRKGGFGYMWEWQGLMDSNHRMTESESVALPLGEAPPPSKWQELMESNHRPQIWSLLFSSTELNSLKGAGKQAGVAPAWVGVKAHPETAGYRHKSYANLSTALCVAPRSPPVLRRHTGNSESII